jgi:RNA polymerase sigma-70 factor, ECF subfamily
MVMSEPVTTQLPQCLPRLWKFALRLTRNTHAAEDLVQRTCLRALEKKHLYEDKHRLLSWLFAIQHRLWLDELSAQAIRVTSPYDDDMQAPDLQDDHATPEDRVFFQQVRHAVYQLREPYRSVMLLVAVEGCSYAECAHIMRTPLGTVMSRLSRARQLIGAQFGDKPSARAFSRGTPHRLSP